MCKAFLILIFLCLLGFSSISVTAQAPPKNQPQPNLNNQKSGVRSNPQPSTGTEPKAEAKVLFDEGMEQTQAGQHSQAAESFRQAVRLDPEYADAYSALGREYFKMQQWQNAIDNLRRATVLHAKQRDANHAPKPTASIESSEKREEPNTAVNSTSTNRPAPKPQQTVNLNSGVKPFTSPSVSSVTPQKTAFTSSRINTNAVALKTVRAASSPAASEHQKQSNTTANELSRSGEIKAPQAMNTNAALLKRSEIAPIEQRNEIKLPVPMNSRAALVKTAPSPSLPALSMKRNGINVVFTTADIKPTQAINVNAAEVRVLNSKSETTKEHDQEDTAAKAARPSGETKVAETSRALDSQMTQQSNVKGNEGNAGQKQEVEGARISMNVIPTSTSLENKSITPTATEIASADVPATQIYRVGPNDVLDIHLNDAHSPLSTLFTVTPSGLLEHPMLPEPLLVAGSTPDEIGAKIESELKQLGSIESPQVIVGVRDYASHAILVSGLVKDPGTRFLRREAIPLYVAVADAQPLPEAASVTVVRNELKRIYEIDLGQAADMGFLVHPGDVITLNPNVTQFVYIGGEVRFPGEKTFRRGLTLMQAIIAAGGATPKSKAAEVGRDNGQGFLVGTRFDLQEIQSGKAADPILRPGDRVMILR